jgi:anthranilate synthase component 2
MILLIDNYDSFSYNLYQLIGSVEPDLKVIRNDVCTVEEIRAMEPQAIFLSPGPGRPADAGVCEDVIRQLGPEIPIFGVCLGHQAICEAFGGTVTYAKELMHGKVSQVTPERDSRLFSTFDHPFAAARYHSLAAEEASLPSVLRVTARTADGEIMAVEHKDYPICGVQFHPESVMTPEGKAMVENFLKSL